MRKLNQESIARIRRAIEAEEACGDQKLATALELLLEWHERQEEYTESIGTKIEEATVHE